MRGGVGGLAALTRPLRSDLGTTFPAGVFATLQGAPLVCFQAERCEESSTTIVSSGRADDLTTSVGTFFSGQKGADVGSMGADEGRWNDLAAGLSAGAGAALLSASASPQMENADIVGAGACVLPGGDAKGSDRTPMIHYRGCPVVSWKGHGSVTLMFLSLRHERVSTCPRT